MPGVSLTERKKLRDDHQRPGGSLTFHWGWDPVTEESHLKWSSGFGPHVLCVP